LWLKSLFFDLGYSCVNTPVIWSDNLAAKSIVKKPAFHSHTKHIEIDVHFVREKVENGEVEIRYVLTSHQVANILTKGLPRNHFLFLWDKHGLKLSSVHLSSSDSSDSPKIGVSSSVMESDLRGNVEEHNA